MTVHHLKVRPPFYAALVSGAKTFELRRNDRDFHCGDTLVLEELDEHGEKTGHSIERRVTQILHSFTDKGDKVIADGFCIMSIRPTGEAVTVGDPYARGIEAGIEAAAKLVVGWREIEPKGDEYERWDTGCKLVADELADRIRSDAASFAPNAPSPSEREKKLEAARSEAISVVQGLFACVCAMEYEPGDNEAPALKDGVLDQWKSRARAFLSDTEGE